MEKTRTKDNLNVKWWVSNKNWTNYL